MPSIHHLRSSDYRVMPWKNGGGTTTELLIDPPGASLDTGFQWRLSMADVGVSGPFSRFAGYDRTLLLLEGRGMELDFGECGGACLDQLLTPVSFSGDWETSGALLDGPCRDFNVITERSSWRHRLEVLKPGLEAVPLPQAVVLLVFCVRGCVRLEPFGETLGESDLLRVDQENRNPKVLVAGHPGSVLLAIGLDPISVS